MKRILLIILFGLLSLPGFCQTKPYTFSTNDPVSSAKINSNYDVIYQWCQELATAAVTLTNKVLSGTTYAYDTIGAADDVRKGFVVADDSAMAAGVGGQLTFRYKYTTTGAYTEGAIIRMYKENATTANYSSGLKFQVRLSGAALSTKMVLDPNGQLWNGNLTNKYWHAGNDGSDSGLDADTLDGYHATTTANTPYTIPVRNSASYLDLGWISTTSGNNGMAVPSRIYASTDTYIRYYTPENFKTVMGLDALLKCRSTGTAIGNADTVKDPSVPHFYYTGEGSTNVPNYYGVIYCFSNLRGAEIYCTQLAFQHASSEMYIRATNGAGSAWLPWGRIWHSANDGSGSGLTSDMIPTAAPARPANGNIWLE